MNPEKDYFEHLRAGRFMIQKSPSTGGHVFYPRVAEPGTGATDLEWVEASGRGTVYSTTVIRQKPPTPNYNLALIDLAEGPRLMSRVDGIAPEAVTIGMPVRARVIVENDQPMVVFEQDLEPPHSLRSLPPKGASAPLGRPGGPGAST